MQIYIEYGLNATIKNISSVKTEQCYAPVFFDDPIDIDKIEGYMTYIGSDSQTHASFDQATWEAYERAKEEERARKQAQAMLDKLSYKTVLDSATDDQALEMRPLYPEWQTGIEYTKGTFLQYDSILYRVLQDHKSQADWTPDSQTKPCRSMSMSPIRKTRTRHLKSLRARMTPTARVTGLLLRKSITARKSTGMCIVRLNIKTDGSL